MFSLTSVLNLVYVFSSSKLDGFTTIIVQFVGLFFLIFWFILFFVLN